MFVSFENLVSANMPVVRLMGSIRHSLLRCVTTLV